MKLRSLFTALMLLVFAPLTASADGEGATGLNCQIKYAINQNWIEFNIYGEGKDKFGLAGDKQVTFTAVEYGTAKTLVELKQAAIASVQWDDDAKAFVVQVKTADTTIRANPQGTLDADLFVRFSTTIETSNTFFRGADLTSLSCYR
ncbi:MAG: hypothetical protein EOP06_00015 [Proteobacteria bacterium]|nr:MAG: hypothetical protein EOP06_00015 [Pseudomonadota bacterium]